MTMALRIGQKENEKNEQCFAASVIFAINYRYSKQSQKIRQELLQNQESSESWHLTIYTHSAAYEPWRAHCMNKHWILLLLSFLMICSAIPAQEKGKVGLNLGFTTYGITWHVSERFAIRPDVSFSRSTASQTNLSTILDQPSSPYTGTSKSNSHAIYVGVSGLVYIHKLDNLSFYICPRYSYSWSAASSSSTSTQISSGSGPFQATSIGGSKGPAHNLSGSFGAQYSLSKRFSVFGEVGLGYNWSSNSNYTSSNPGVYQNLSSSSAKTHSVGPRSGVGLILYFN